MGYWCKALYGSKRSLQVNVERLTFVWEILHLQLYLWATKRTVQVIHHSLEWILNLVDASCRLVIC